MNKYQILAIMGKAGSGKDTLCRILLQQPQFATAKPIVHSTTRPIRDNETDGIDYHFITNEEFTDEILSGQMLEATVFNNWCYGTSISSLTFDCLYIGVFNPEAIGLLKSRDDIDIKVIYLEAKDKDRLLRQLNREKDPDCHEIVRRFTADEHDFSEEEIDYIEPDVFVTNNNGADINKIASTIAEAWGQF